MPESLRDNTSSFSLPRKIQINCLYRGYKLFHLFRKLLFSCIIKIMRFFGNNNEIGSYLVEPIVRACNSKFFYRWYFSRKYLKTGNGIEIGPSFLPLDVSSNVNVKYVDITNPTDQYKLYPLVKEEELVDIDIIDDGEKLSSFDCCSLDFIIANHFIEHALNPIDTLCNFLRVLRRHGIIFMAVPNRRDTFDKVRPLTDIGHIIDVYETGVDNLIEDHYREVVTLVELSPADQIKSRVEYLIETRFSIHYHTYELSNFLQIIEYMQEKGIGIKVMDYFYDESGSTDEFIIILMKTEDM